MPLHPPLLSALGKFRRASIPAGKLLFHGGRTESPHADPAARRLTGTRKWFSEDAIYAVSYSFVDGEQYGAPLLWVCQAGSNIASLQGSQFSLQQSQPWGFDFPWAFPNFGEYAAALLGGAGPFALLDHHDGARYREVLVTSPEGAVQVVDVIALPPNKQASVELVRDRLGLQL